MSVVQTQLRGLPLSPPPNKWLLYHTVSPLFLIPPPPSPFFFPVKQWIITLRQEPAASAITLISVPGVYWLADHSDQVKGNVAISLRNV